MSSRKTTMAGGVIVSATAGKDCPGNLTLHVFITCVIAATGGGVISMDDFLKKFFPAVHRRQSLVHQSVNQYCAFDSQILTLFTSSLYLAALVSSIFASYITRKLGRRVSMVAGGLLFAVGAILNGFSQNLAMLIIGRLLLGFGIGSANQSVPIYLSEVAPHRYRGGLNMMFQLSITIGIINALATVVSIFTVDKSSRIIYSTAGRLTRFTNVNEKLVVALAIGLKFGVNGNPGDLPTWYAVIVVILICIFVAGYAWSWGPLGWLVPSEIFPLEIRSAAQSINVSMNMIFTFIIAQVFTAMLCHMKFGLFVFFAFFIMIMGLFIYYLLPETKGVPIEEMITVWKNHPYWRKYFDHDDLPSGKKVELV
ncbi:hypothetical protein GH714_023709 [Hevea brasiliensis]|uniref:Major facilitator superfamily (MFS) profile domain-containing protein n=1 Tax=Hevea brasiliensis TaxID=3981 RepID=A0A6A6N5G5_HEVBR|nr:hypothetical protein GH714_023709 [Hevea brasiliensis]